MKSTKPELPPMLNLESRLLEDREGQYKHELLEEFNNVAMQAKQITYQGVPPAEYEALRRFEQSVITAVQVIEKIWGRYHHAQ